MAPWLASPPQIGRQAAPIGRALEVMNIKDGGDAGGESAINLAIARRTRTLLLRHGYRVAMTRTGPVFRYGNGGNIARAQFCNRRHSALLLRIHAHASPTTSLPGIKTLCAPLHARWTDDSSPR